MKKTFICLLSCLLICNIAFAAVRKNWKVTKNAVTILKEQKIEIAKHIYGEPDKIISNEPNQMIYLWGGSGEKLQEIQTKTVSSEKGSHSHSFLDYGYPCFIALKIDNNGIIKEGIQVGFEADKIYPQCSDIFWRSYHFCKSVIQATEKEQKIRIKNFHRYDLSQESHINFVIPQEYQNDYFYQEDYDINKFFNN